MPQIIKDVRKKANKRKYLWTMCMSLGISMGIDNITGVASVLANGGEGIIMDVGISISGHGKGLNRESSFNKIQ